MTEVYYSTTFERPIEAAVVSRQGTPLYSRLSAYQFTFCFSPFIHTVLVILYRVQIAEVTVHVGPHFFCFTAR